jgi:hypothetical protein
MKRLDEEDKAMDEEIAEIQRIIKEKEDEN